MSDLFKGKTEARHGEHAHARRTDPDTSHEAADAATVEIKGKRALVERYARGVGPAGFMDIQMSEALGDEGSTLRTRRSELTEQNIILDSGRRGRWGDSARERIIWVHRNFVDNPPPIIGPQITIESDRPVGVPDHLKQSAIAMAVEFDGYAKTAKAEGRSFLAERMEANAALLRALAR